MRHFKIVDFLQAQKAALSTERSSADEAERSELDGLLTDIAAAEILITSHAAARGVAREKLAKWKAVVRQCRAALDRLQQINSDFESQQSEVAELREAADSAFDAVMQHRDRIPRATDYPTAEEIAEHAAEENRLVRAHEDAVAKVREANEKQGWLGAGLLKAREELGRLEFQERQLRAPGQAPEPAVARGAVGQLSGVR